MKQPEAVPTTRPRSATTASPAAEADSSSSTPETGAKATSRARTAAAKARSADRYITVQLTADPVADVADWPAPTPEQADELRRLLPPAPRVKAVA